MNNNIKVASRNYVLDSFRLFAAIGVVALHTLTDSSYHGWAQWLFPLMGACVPLFFMLSGYYIRSLDKNQKQLSKLLSLYLYTLILYSSFSFVFYGWDSFNWIYDFHNWLGIMLCGNTPWSPVMWFFGSMILLLLMNKILFFRMKPMMLLIMCIVSLVISNLFVYFNISEGILTKFTVWIQGIPFFLMGKTIYQFEDKKKYILITSILSVLLIVAYSAYICGESRTPRYAFIASCLISACSFFTGIIRPIQNNVMKILGTLGLQYSLGIYMYHMIALAITPAILNRLGLSKLFDTNRVITVCLVTIAIVMVDLQCRKMWNKLKHE